MRGQRLRQGMHIRYGGREYTIEKRLSSGELQLKDVITDERRAVEEAVLRRDLFSGDVVLLGESGEYDHLQAKQALTRITDLSALEEEDEIKKQTNRRLAYVRAVVAAGITKFTDEVLRPVIEKVSRVLGDPDPPSRWSVHRWTKDYVRGGEDARAVVPAVKAQGNRSRKISQDIEKCNVVVRIVNEVIGEKYLSLERPTIDSVYTTVVARIAQENKFRKDDPLPTPHKSTIYREIKKIDPYERDVARLGKRIADLRHQVVKQGERPTRPLERVESDDTKLDLFVIDESTKMPLGRPWLITLICVYTKMILGYFLSFVPPSYLSVQQCLLHAIRPKDYVRDKYPEIENTWESYGLMETLVVDNAKHWHSASFEEACLRFGIIVQYAPPRTPWYKPSIERFFRSLNTRLIHLLPGKTFSNIFDKGDYDPKKNAVITLQELEKLLHHWIIDVYQQSKHRGIDDVPARLWKIGIDKHPPALPPNKEELQVLLGHITWRVISKSGVELFGLYYNDLSLARVRSGLKKGQKVKVKYDPTDLSIIYVHDPHDKRFVPTPAVDQGYTQGLSVWQHNIIRKLARQGVDDYVDIVKLCAARERIEGMVASAFKKLRKSGTNVKAARWMNDSQKGRRGTVERAEEGAAVSRDDSELDNADARSEAVNHSEAGISDIGTAFTADVDSNGGIAKGEGNKTNSSAVIGTQQTRKSKSGKGKKQNKAGAKDAPPVRPMRHGKERNLDMTGWGVDYGSSK